MFKLLLRFMASAVIILFASPVFAISVTYQLSVTVPPHTTPAADITEQKEALVNGIPKITTQLVIQQEEITRNDQRVTVRSTVVL